VKADALIRELIATGAMNEDTLADLERMRADAEAGTHDPDDEAYLRALHARVTNAPMPEPIEDTPSAPAGLDGLSIEQWRDRALAAESELQSLRDQQTPDAADPA
jgi:hypothetical protein